MSYSFIEQCKRDGSLVGFWNLMRGNANFNDLSGQGNHGTPSNVWWGGGGVQFNDPNGYIQVADATVLQGATWTLAALGDWTRLERAADATSGRLISKRDGGGTQYDWILDSTPRLELYDGTSTRLLATEYRGHRLLAVSFTDGGTPVGYIDGVSVGNYSGTVAIAADDAPVYMGNWYSATRSLYNPLHAVLIFNDQLTATEHAQLHGELMAMPGGEH